MNKIINHVKEISIIIPYLLLLIGAILFLGVYRDMQALAARNEKLETSLQKTSEKLDYYMYRDSTSLGHTEGPEGYEIYKQRMGK